MIHSCLTVGALWATAVGASVAYSRRRSPAFFWSILSPASWHLQTLWATWHHRLLCANQPKYPTQPHHSSTYLQQNLPTFIKNWNLSGRSPAFFWSAPGRFPPPLSLLAEIFSFSFYQLLLTIWTYLVLRLMYQLGTLIDLSREKNLQSAHAQ